MEWDIQLKLILMRVKVYVIIIHYVNNTNGINQSQIAIYLMKFVQELTQGQVTEHTSHSPKPLVLNQNLIVIAKHNPHNLHVNKL